MKKIFYFNFSTKIIALSFGALILLAAIFFVPTSQVIFEKKVEKRSENELRKYAEDVLGRCSSVGYKPTCYDEEIPKLLDIITMEDAFQVTRYVQEKRPEYLYCHVLGHNIAEQETRKDPSRWKDVVARCPTTMCNNGCPHGALMERFKSNVNDYLTEEQIASIKADLTDVCEPRASWNPREIERSMCYHALGHLHMYITDANLRRSAELCREVGTKSDGRNYIQTCTEGVFMSIYQPLSPEDFALVKDLTPTKESMPEFCDKFKDDEMSYHACHKEAWIIFRNEVATPEGYIKFCSYTDEPIWQETCQGSLMNVLVDTKIIQANDINWLKNFCSQVPARVQPICVRATVHRLVQVDPKLAPKAVEVCQEMSSLGQNIEEDCYNTLLAFSVRGFLKDTPELKSYCGFLPDSWKDKCLSGVPAKKLH